MIRAVFIITAIFALYDNPPHKTQAEINKQTVHQAEVKPVEPVVQTQPKVEAETPKPVPQPVKEVVKSHPIGCENYRQLISSYDWNVEIAMKVMQAESGCNPNAVGDRHIPPVSCGLFQIRTLEGRPSCEELQIPETNVAWAYRLYTANSWQPWSVCRTKVSCY